MRAGIDDPHRPATATPERAAHGFRPAVGRRRDLRRLHHHVGAAEPRMSGGSPQQRENRRLTGKLLLFVAGSFAFGFALVPLYRVLCELTGFGDQKLLGVAVSAAGVGSADTARTVTVEFVATLPTVGNWEFRPTQKTLQVHPGALYATSFVARNLTGHDTVAQ